MDFKFVDIREVLYSVGNLQQVLDFFVGFGGWSIIHQQDSLPSQLEFWDLDSFYQAKEVLLRSGEEKNGQIRLVTFSPSSSTCLRSSQNPWDIGGIMDINLRVHSVEEIFNELREIGWHGLSDPLLQSMGPFELYDILMKGYDDIIIAFTHRVKPSMPKMAPHKLPSPVYHSSITVPNLEEATKFYTQQLGCQLLHSYSVIKDRPQENMFGLPFNLADKVRCNANILSFTDKGEINFQLVSFEGISGKDHRVHMHPPNRGWLLYRVEVHNIKNYYEVLKGKGIPIKKELKRLEIPSYGECLAFAIQDKVSTWWTFFQPLNFI